MCVHVSSITGTDRSIKVTNKFFFPGKYLYLLPKVKTTSGVQDAKTVAVHCAGTST